MGHQTSSRKAEEVKQPQAETSLGYRQTNLKRKGESKEVSQPVSQGRQRLPLTSAPLFTVFWEPTVPTLCWGLPSVFALPQDCFHLLQVLGPFSWKPILNVNTWPFISSWASSLSFLQIIIIIVNPKPFSYKESVVHTCYPSPSSTQVELEFLGLSSNYGENQRCLIECRDDFNYPWFWILWKDR